MSNWKTKRDLRIRNLEAIALQTRTGHHAPSRFGISGDCRVEEEVQEVVLYSIVKEHKRGFGSVFDLEHGRLLWLIHSLFALNFCKSSRHKPSYLLIGERNENNFCLHLQFSFFLPLCFSGLW
jgi:hypothetical protein